ncbi:hypothetical protein RYJ27_12355 [Microbacterium limosum]|uniref:Uncharacterized protein n=1 Tax=Microbacterium limosum TaxID=3079935 RepID=A0AAU0MG61_9MICO|nr:hypothetical protein [Microbacterium sp. Y20]WOQ69471.1 hypothetical protein RYJ27_12355 [Microbacterium sp. Y20]
MCIVFAADDGLQLHERAGWAALDAFPEMGTTALFLEYLVFDAPMTALEDGGEIVTMSFVVSFLFAVAFAGHRPDARAWPSRQTRGRTNR